MSENPLISFLLIAYKQEGFIREAVRSAFEQTYTPLEIILSDDCSPDRTFEIMKEEAATYKGPHTIILNRNETNVGLVGNLNRGWELCHGEFIVLQAGDDISLPHRVVVLSKVWREPTPVDCVFSDVMGIDAQGFQTAASMIGPKPDFITKSPEDVLEKKLCTIWGCSSGYSRSLMTKYGPLDTRVLAEDNVLPFRAILNGGVRYCDDVLVKYRLHDSNLFHGSDEKRRTVHKERKRWAVSNAAIASEWLKALDMSGQFPGSLREEFVSIERRCKYYVLALDVPRYKLPFLALKGIREGLSLRNAAGLVKRNLFLSRTQIR